MECQLRAVVRQAPQRTPRKDVTTCQRCFSQTPLRASGRRLGVPNLLRYGVDLTANSRSAVKLRCSNEGVSETTTDDKENAQLVDGIRVLLPEVVGLDFPRNELRLYFGSAMKPPRAFPNYDMTKILPIFDEILANEPQSRRGPVPEISVGDTDGLKILKGMLTDLWRWRRRGGGFSDVRVHQAALEDLQNMQPEDIEKISSVLLDNLPMTEDEKAEIGGAVQQVAMVGIQSIIWNGIALAVLFLIVFNFLLLSR